jgi:hypothetical protein
VTQNMLNLIFWTIICIKLNFLWKWSIYHKSCDFSIFSKNFKNKTDFKTLCGIFYVFIDQLSEIDLEGFQKDISSFVMILWFTGQKNARLCPDFVSRPKKCKNTAKIGKKVKKNQWRFKFTKDQFFFGQKSKKLIFFVMQPIY